MATTSPSDTWSPGDIASAGAVELSGERSRRHSGKEVTPSSDVGLQPRLLFAPKEELYVPPEFQRLVNMGHVNKILANYNHAYVHVIHTGLKNERGYPIIDGQHEWLASMKHPLVTEVPLAEAYWADTIAKMADIFVTLNNNRINITQTGIFYARVAQGDAEALWIDELLTEAGCKMSRVMTGGLPPLTTCAIGTFKRLRPYEAWMKQALALMAQAWPTQYGAFQGTMIEAVTKFVIMQEKNGFNSDRLRNVLTRMGSMDEVTRARRQTFGVTSVEFLIDVLTKNYNERLSLDKQLPRVSWTRDKVVA